MRRIIGGSPFDDDRAFARADGDVPHFRDEERLRSEAWDEIAGSLKVGNVEATVGGVVEGRSRHVHRNMIIRSCCRWTPSLPVL
jgi:hypothetical protein